MKHIGHIGVLIPCRPQSVGSWAALTPFPRPIVVVRLSHGSIRTVHAIISNSRRLNRGPVVLQALEKIGQAESESFQLLEWPDLCRQVASFCQTPMGAQQAWAGRLPLGSSIEESQFLQSQTREAAIVDVKFNGIFDLRRALEAAEQGRVLHPLVLGAVARTLEASENLKQSVLVVKDSARSLWQIASCINTALPELRQEISACIQISEGKVVNEASEHLAAIRAARRDNLAALRRTADEWARNLHSSGAAERPQVVIRRDRLCIPVRAGRQSDLPRGSVPLATSGSGGTVYMEPAPLMPLNNAEAALSASEAVEEERILRELTTKVAQHADDIRDLLSTVASLDLASARARHALWLQNSVEPKLQLAASAHHASEGLVALRNVLHPLLMQRFKLTAPLPPPPLPEVTLTLRDPGSGGLAGVELVPELLRELERKADPSNSNYGSRKSRRRPRSAARDASGVSAIELQGENLSSVSAEETTSGGLMPIDLVVPPGVCVVAVTGPNTGGKTASLKTLGLISLMAKAGMRIPIALGNGQLNGDHSLKNPTLTWFDRVLADIGDGQSLQQSLSTFSGHVRRLKGIFEESTPDSLVLLDEVGSGTDPTEGAALAASLLLRLASGRAALTYATTHHAEIKEVADLESAFVNASVEFDAASLRPTHRLIWGTAGESNALSVAETLGFDPKVVSGARVLVRKLREIESGSMSGLRGSALRTSLAEQVLDAATAATTAGTRRAAAEAAQTKAQKELEVRKREYEALGDGAAAAKVARESAQSETRRILAAVKQNKLTLKEADTELRRLERRVSDANAAAMALAGLKYGGQRPVDDAFLPTSDEAASVQEGWKPQEGDWVEVLKMGGAIGQVVSSGGSGGGRVSVKVGGMTMQLRPAELAPSARAAPLPRTTPSASSAKKFIEARSRGGGARLGVAVQTTRNTVDVRGRTSEEAEGVVDAAVRDAGPGAVLFIVHGVGTGKVRTAVLNVLRRNAGVERMEEAEGSNGGCTVVYLRAQAKSAQVFAGVLPSIDRSHPMLPWVALASLLGAGLGLKFIGNTATKKRQDAILKLYTTLFSVPKSQMEALKAEMLRQMELGLKGIDGGLMMLPSYVDVLPTGNETGEYYAIDLGGSNLRVLWVRLGSQRGFVEEEDVQEWPIPEECYSTDNGRLLNWVAERALEIMARRKQPGSAQIPVIGFCFSFACRQTALDNGELLLWTKSFRGRGLIGQDVVAALIAAFKARGVTVSVPAMMNDTVATLVALKYSEPSTCAGIILGTGTNCAYLENVNRIKTLPAGYRPCGPKMVINTEWGDLKDTELPRCEEDIWVDCSSANPGHGLFEKLISGLYMGEVARRILLRLAERGHMFGGVKGHAAGSPIAWEGALGSAAVAAIDQDDSPDLHVTSDVLVESLGLRDVRRRELKIARHVCMMVANRSARLCAAAIAAVLENCSLASDEPVVVAVDGSVFAKYHKYRQHLRDALVELVGKERAHLVVFKLVHGGSAAGAAFIAAAAASKTE